MRSSIFISFAVGSFLFLSCSKDEPTLENEELSIDLNNSARVEALNLYQDFYLASSTSTSTELWTGDEASCNPGTTPQTIKDKIFLRLDYYRKAVGLNNTLTENSLKSTKSQDAALMMHTNGSLNHFPPNSWKCFSDAGKEAAANSLLTSISGAAAIDSYIRDQGAENGPVGHRRWLLWPRLQEMGIGNTNRYNALWVIGNAGTAPADAPDFIAWPPEGFIPKQVVYPRWSFSIANADFSTTTVRMKYKNGGTVSLQTEDLSEAFADNTIVWQPDLNLNTIKSDTTFVVTLKSVVINGEETDFEYEVVVFDGSDDN
ncbi:CAP domain-containing protein [Pseudozobellia sp. WGM2]|uniref:CAP domain-containing protein n=1 Tax=Pseudozobellia sp. WGM2 TaxID=2787625 RepID=UPI001AE09A8A|nr:CAP domain-containing protein [Pseudozobellia sp. WGM2]